jgi:ATP/maltotriose-dependent transcriptional regulator MalT
MGAARRLARLAKRSTSPANISPMSSSWMCHQEREREAALAALTRREIDVVGLLAEGENTVTISARLHISALTVKTHIRSVLAKLDSHSQLQALAKAQTLGILPGVQAP